MKPKRTGVQVRLHPHLHPPKECVHAGAFRAPACTFLVGVQKVKVSLGCRLQVAPHQKSNERSEKKHCFLPRSPCLPTLPMTDDSYKARRRALQKMALIDEVRAGATKSGACRTVDINRRTLYRWLDQDLDFLMEFDAAWTQGKEKRTYLCWLNHPFRGLRPPTGKGTRSRPRFAR